MTKIPKIPIPIKTTDIYKTTWNTSVLVEYLSMNRTGMKVPTGVDANKRNNMSVLIKVLSFTPNQVLENLVAPFIIKINPNDVMYVPRI